MVLSVKLMADTPSSGNEPYLPLGIVLAMLGAILARILVFGTVEWRHLANTMAERQYYRWANEFSRSNATEEAPEIDDSKTLLHQYRPWWLAAVLIIGPAGLLALGYEVRVMVWVRPVSAAILIETILRVILELVWLRTAAGVVCKRFIMRWAPRVHMHIGYLT